jgi:hypothetical protein
MLDPITFVFMGISIISVGLNIPLLKNFKKCSYSNDENGEMKCHSSCKTKGTNVRPPPPQIESSSEKTSSKTFDDKDYRQENESSF